MVIGYGLFLICTSGQWDHPLVIEHFAGHT
jgi:hypothetical protein